MYHRDVIFKANPEGPTCCSSGPPQWTPEDRYADCLKPVLSPPP